MDQYVTLNGQSAGEVSEIVKTLLQPASKAAEFVTTLKELWLECNVLRRAAVNVR